MSSSGCDFLIRILMATSSCMEHRTTFYRFYFCCSMFKLRKKNIKKQFSKKEVVLKATVKGRFYQILAFIL